MLTSAEVTVEHGDSLGNRGLLGAGDVQWMTAGSGIMHQEMPQGDAQGRMHGFQLWANLPSSLKMTKPRYQDIEPEAIPEVDAGGGVRDIDDHMARLGHELSDCLWSIIVLANKCGIDLEAEFAKNTRELVEFVSGELEK